MKNINQSHRKESDSGYSTSGLLHASYLERTIKKASDWVFFKIDGFFQGPQYEESPIYTGFPGRNEAGQVYSREWDLNQDVADIALKDINKSLGWLIPSFIKHFTIKLKQEIMLYLYIDPIIEDDAFNVSNFSGLPQQDLPQDKSKIIFIMTGIKSGIKSGIVSVNDWWIHHIHLLSKLFKPESRERTYYLLGSFVPQGLEYQPGSSVFMNRAPDKVKFHTGFAFHKRN